MFGKNLNMFLCSAFIRENKLDMRPYTGLKNSQVVNIQPNKNTQKKPTKLMLPIKNLLHGLLLQTSLKLTTFL